MCTEEKGGVNIAINGIKELTHLDKTLITVLSRRTAPCLDPRAGRRRELSPSGCAVFVLSKF
jgi:hypothetical protein